MSSLEIIDSKERISTVEARRKYRGSEYLLINTERIGTTIYGTVYALSHDYSSLGEINSLEDELQEKGIKTFIGGEYSPSDMFNSIELNINMEEYKYG